MLTWDVSTGLSHGRSRIEEGQTPALVPSFIKSGAGIRAGSVQMKSRSLLLQRKHGRDFTRIYPRTNRYQADSRVTHNNISDYETHWRESIKNQSSGGWAWPRRLTHLCRVCWNTAYSPLNYCFPFNLYTHHENISHTFLKYKKIFSSLTIFINPLLKFLSS